jgi:hypothetical protein
LYGELGLEKAARAEGEQAARLSPQASLESLRHSVPYQDERDLGRFLAGMRKAGLE